MYKRQHKALLLGTSGLVAVLMGMMTGVAGGMVRDMLARRVPMVLREEIYATAAIAGGIAYVGLHALGAPGPLAIALSLMTTLGLRLAAIHWHLALPTFAWVVIPHSSPAPGEPVAEGQPASPPPIDPPRPKVRVRMIRPEQSRRRKRP